jgi:hypothetical protein
MSFCVRTFYGCHIERCRFIDCEFVEENGFSHCDVESTTFKNCFFNKRKFFNCKFDESTNFVFTKGPLLIGLKSRPREFKENLERDQVSGVYRGIAEGYSAGHAWSLA